MADNWEQELRDAGWTATRFDLWKSPHGDLYRGPFKAWQVMKSIQQWGLKRCTECRAVASRGGTIQHAKTCVNGDCEILVEGIMLYLGS
jgi:hypothetical protein